MRERRDILQRANAVVDAGARAEGEQWTGTVEELFTGSGFPISEGGGGPAGSESPRVWARATFLDAKGDVVYRSLSIRVSWSDDLSDIEAQLNEMIDTMGEGYGLEAGALEGPSLLIG